MKPTWDPAWQQKHQRMIATPAEAASRIRSGNRVFVATGCAQPLELVRAMTARTDLVDVEVVHFITHGDAPYAKRELSDAFRVNSLYIADNVRDIIQEGLGDYTPVYLSDVPALFSSGQIPLDVALVQVTPPDEKGSCSLGISVDIVKSAMENARLVIAQVNPNMPRTQGDCSVSVMDLDILVPVDVPLEEVPPPPIEEETQRIGEFVAALVEDGSTIQFGIGSIPQAVARFLKGRKNLGIHTEMITDSIIPLIESGAVTGSLKTADRGRIVTSFCVGTRHLYEFVDGNPMFAFYPTDYVNDPLVIGRQYKPVAINHALELDLTGQVCGDSLGMAFYSGTGGVADFNRAAAHTPGGKAIIVLPSTARSGAVSRIVTKLNPGAGVVTTRAGVQYVVTEYGVAYLHGKSVQERAIALISIAHPKFRAQLLKEAVEAKYLRPDYASIEGKIMVGPPEFRTTAVLRDGTPVSIRPIHPTDEPRMRDLFYALSQQTMFYRFMSRTPHVPRKEFQNYVYINHRSDVALVATMPEAYGDDVIAIGRYILNEKTNFAEVAFVVRDDWQNRGIGTALLRHLSTIAKRNGIKGFTAEVLSVNRGMQRVFDRTEYQVTKVPKQDVFSYRIEFE